MPDNRCYECFECEHSFNLINRKHHCCKCGKIFCGTCTDKTIHYQSRTITDSASSYDDKGSNFKENTHRIRVCNHCFRLWEEETAMCVSSTCSSDKNISETNSNYEGLDGLSGFYYDLLDHHFANGAHGSEESSPREPLLDISYNNRDFVRSENKMTAKEEKETLSSAQYEMSDDEDEGIYQSRRQSHYTQSNSKLMPAIIANLSLVYITRVHEHNDDKFVEEICSMTIDKMDDESDANNSYDYHATSSLYKIVPR